MLEHLGRDDPVECRVGERECERIALDRAAGALDRTNPGLAARVAAALEREPGLAATAARGKPAALL
ncbi:MAG TPA: hypothetical protein VFW74_14490, partial [Acidimicrobiia bacterium]|nr:hypothetical protein [Acidimicrobiia bacterium]